MQIIFETSDPKQLNSLKNIELLPGQKALLICDDKLQLTPIPHFLQYAVPGGEGAKTLKTAESLYLEMERSQLDKESLIIGVGGGTISDLTGFLAATYLRGISLILTPTTLLGMIDASIGGKNGLNLGKKNAIGAIYHPKFLIINPLWLHTLKPLEYRQGLAEAVKYGVIEGEPFLDFLEKNTQAIKNQDTKIMLDLIKWCIEIKTGIVNESKRDPEARDILNFGHTFGHAIESASDFSIPHGDAIAIGMMLALNFSESSGLIDKNSVLRINRILEAFDLPTHLPLLDRDKILYWMKQDKKNRFGKICLILAEKIGKVFKSPELPLEEVKKILL